MNVSITCTVDSPPPAPGDPVSATLSERFLAFLIDSILAGFVFWALFRMLNVPVITPAQPFWAELLATILWPVRWTADPTLPFFRFSLYWAVIPVFMFYRFLGHLAFGKTVGKYIVGIELMHESGKRTPRPVAILLRDTLGFALSFPCGLGYLLPTALDGSKGKALRRPFGVTVVRQRRHAESAENATPAASAILS